MSLSMKETQRLRDTWGDKLCTHPNITKEKHMGQDSDYACEQCGAVSHSRADLEKKGKEIETLLNAKG
jgi:hypothetical protein